MCQISRHPIWSQRDFAGSHLGRLIIGLGKTEECHTGETLVIHLVHISMPKSNFSVNLKNLKISIKPMVVSLGFVCLGRHFCRVSVVHSWLIAALGGNAPIEMPQRGGIRKRPGISKNLLKTRRNVIKSKARNCFKPKETVAETLHIVYCTAGIFVTSFCWPCYGGIGE